MKFIFVFLVLVILVSCSSTRLVICPSKKVDRLCIESQLPRDSKVLSVKPTEEKDVYEVRYRE